MKARSLYKKLKKIEGIKVSLQESLSKHASLRIGGKSTVFIIPKNEAALAETLHILKSRRNSIFIIGNGSKLLFPDKGICGVVIKIGGGIDFIDINDSIVKVGAGTNIQKLIKILAKKGLGGLEFAAGVPASVGGAIWMNLGAYGKEIWKLVKEIKTMSFGAKTKIWKKKQKYFGYRSSIFQNKKLIITEVSLKLPKGKPKTIKKRIEKFLAMRKSSQPLSVPSAGSTFKNPKGSYAAKLIEDSGAKGLRLGDAQFSTKHANFVINLGDAKSKDIISLIERVRKLVKTKTNITLVPEIRIVKG